MDRDGTIIRDAHYLRDPSQVELLPGAAAALARFQSAGWALVVITNQSGIARGVLTETEYAQVQSALDDLLRAEGVTLDATFHCPHHPDFTGLCACRKPEPLLYERARDTLGLDVARSVLVGDRWRDIAAAERFGARGVLVPGPDTPADDVTRARALAEVADDLGAMARLVLGA